MDIPLITRCPVERAASALELITCYVRKR